jgi:hypothetical protein
MNLLSALSQLSKDMCPVVARLAQNTEQHHKFLISPNPGPVTRTLELRIRISLHVINMYPLFLRCSVHTDNCDWRNST